MNCNSTPSLKYWRGSKESVRESLSLRPRPFTRVLYWMESGWQKGSRTKSPENRFLLFLLPLMSVRCRTPSPQQTCQALVSYYHFFFLQKRRCVTGSTKEPRLLLQLSVHLSPAVFTSVEGKWDQPARVSSGPARRYRGNSDQLQWPNCFKLGSVSYCWNLKWLVNRLSNWLMIRKLDFPCFLHYRCADQIWWYVAPF